MNWLTGLVMWRSSSPSPESQSPRVTRGVRYVELWTLADYSDIDFQWFLGAGPTLRETPDSSRRLSTAHNCKVCCHSVCFVGLDLFQRIPKKAFL